MLFALDVATVESLSSVRVHSCSDIALPVLDLFHSGSSLPTQSHPQPRAFTLLLDFVATGTFSALHAHPHVEIVLMMLEHFNLDALLLFQTMA